MGTKADEVAWHKLQVASSNGQRSVILASQVEHDELSYRHEAIARLRSWENRSWGKMIVGRRGSETRFQLSSSTIKALKSAAATLAPQSSTSKAVSAAGSGTAAAGKPILIKHPFRLRPDFEIELQLPDDVTEREAQRIARFVESIPV